MATTIEVLSRRNVFSSDPSRIGKEDKLIIYRVNRDPTTSFFVQIPKEQWTEQAEQDAITKAEQERVLHQPRQFQIP